MTKTKPKSVREIATAKLAENAEKERLQREADAKKAAEQREANARDQVKGFLERSLGALQEAFKAAADPQNPKFNPTPFFNLDINGYNHRDYMFTKYVTPDTLQQDPLFKEFNKACKKADVQFCWDIGSYTEEVEPYDSLPHNETHDYLKLHVDMTRPYAGAQRADMKNYRR
jgi:hypothetical protein